ncbi:acyl-CoA dehydrogenase family protein [Actinomadura madurae]|uniref:acyl-CoA dehydrogenase family protein n=1 Tax=Actinomadura madurae TaxID=1993 RepID=UPI00399BDBAE
MTIELRRNDYSFDEQQTEVRAMLAGFFGRHSPADVVRAAEPLGFDPALWQNAEHAGIVGLALPEARGGQGAGLVELAFAAEAAGRTLAPVPLADHAVAARALCRLDGGGIDVDAAVSGETIYSLAPLPHGGSGRHLVPSGALAHGVLARRGTELVLLRRDTPPPQTANDAAAPVALWDPADPEVSQTVLATGDVAEEAWRKALSEWRVVTAAALVGLGDGAVALARDYALERHQFGVPIATFQAVGHRLVDAHEAVEAARNLTLKAAWFQSEEPLTRPELPVMALANAARVAPRITGDCVHVHGGFGLMLESDISLYHRRSALWGRLGGGSRIHLAEIATALDRVERRPVPGRSLVATGGA